MTTPADDVPPDLAAVAHLGEAFKRLGMPRHVELLRAYYRARSGNGTAAWSDAFVLDWLRLFRVPPHDAYYSVRARGSNCEACAVAGRAGGKFTRAVWPGGACSQCGTCGERWIELETLP